MPGHTRLCCQQVSVGDWPYLDELVEPKAKSRWEETWEIPTQAIRVNPNVPRGTIELGSDDGWQTGEVRA